MDAISTAALQVWSEDLNQALKIEDEDRFLESLEKADAKYRKAEEPILDVQLKYTMQSYELGRLPASQFQYNAFETEFFNCEEKYMNKKITRGVSDKFTAAFVTSPLYDLYKSNQKDLFLGIRNGYVNLYYNAASVCKVTYDSRKNKLNCITANKYFGINRTGYITISTEELKVKYKKIISTIKDHYSHDEKTAQQLLVCKNNSNKKSKWFCIDIEYVKQRYSRNENTYGRFDIIAITKDKPHKVALIELKYGVDAIGGKSGIVKHADDFIEFTNKEIYATHLKKEIVEVVDGLNKLNICPLCITDETELEDNPDFYFISLNNENDEVRKRIRRYVLNDVSGASSFNVEKKHGYKITEPNKIGFTPTFLFSDNKVNNIKIDDIIESKLYSIGL